MIDSLKERTQQLTNTHCKIFLIKIVLNEKQQYHSCALPWFRWSHLLVCVREPVWVQLITPTPSPQVQHVTTVNHQQLQHTKTSLCYKSCTQTGSLTQTNKCDHLNKGNAQEWYCCWKLKVPLDRRFKVAVIALTWHRIVIIRQIQKQPDLVYRSSLYLSNCKRYHVHCIHAGPSLPSQTEIWDKHAPCYHRNRIS